MVALAHVDVDIAVLAANLGFVGVDAKRTADRVAAEQKALRASQDFSALNVVKAGDNRTVASFIEVILEERRGRVATHAKVLRSHAAHTDRVNVGILGVAAYPGGIGDQVFDVVQIGVGNKVTRQRGDGQRHIHDALLPLGGGHQHLFQRLG